MKVGFAGMRFMMGIIEIQLTMHLHMNLHTDSITVTPIHECLKQRLGFARRLTFLWCTMILVYIMQSGALAPCPVRTVRSHPRGKFEPCFRTLLLRLENSWSLGCQFQRRQLHHREK